MSSNFNVGYSAWGFLSDGIVDTPDGGRSHRPVLLDGLISHGAEIIMLQKDRDLHEAGVDVTKEHLRFDDKNFPDIDVLFLEYRWPIPGRNIEVEKSDPLYTPDLDRQQELIDHYNKLDKPIFIWDKDQQLTQEHIDTLGIKNVLVFEPALQPKPGRKSLLFPMDMSRILEMKEDLKGYDKKNKSISLVYVGNQYDRDDSFKKYYNEASRLIGKRAEIYGKWRNQEPFSYVNFHGRVGYSEVQTIYEQSFANVLIAPERYYKNGQYTQRIFESLWGLCLPLVPKEYACSDVLFPDELIVESAEDVARILTRLNDADNHYIVDLFEAIFENLTIFSVDKQVQTILDSFSNYYE